jgi:hypothetical protein
MRLIRRFDRRPVVVVLAALGWQVLNAVFWPQIFNLVVRLHLADASSSSFWESRLVTSYAFFVVTGIVVALHLDDVHAWIIAHRRSILIATVSAAIIAGGLNQWDISGPVRRIIVPGNDPFAVAVIPYEIGAILSVYLLGIYLVDHRRSSRTRAIVSSGANNSYGVYLSQMLWIPVLVRLRHHLFSWIPWPIATVAALVIVYVLGFAFSVLAARTPLARVLTGQTPVRWSLSRSRRTAATPRNGDVADGPLDVGLVH